MPPMMRRAMVDWRIRSTHPVYCDPRQVGWRTAAGSAAGYGNPLEAVVLHPQAAEVGMGRRLLPVAVSCVLGAGGCAELNQLAALVRAPQFEQAADRQAEICVMGAGSGLPLGGAGVRLWARVTNPNPFALTLGTLKGTLYLEDSRAADVDFPLGLPLAAGGESVVPIDVTVSFANLPGLADTIRRAASRQPLA